MPLSSTRKISKMNSYMLSKVRGMIVVLKLPGYTDHAASQQSETWRHLLSYMSVNNICNLYESIGLTESMRENCGRNLVLGKNTKKIYLNCDQKPLAYVSRRLSRLGTESKYSLIGQV